MPTPTATARRPISPRSYRLSGSRRGERATSSGWCGRPQATTSPAAFSKQSRAGLPHGRRQPDVAEQHLFHLEPEADGDTVAELARILGAVGQDVRCPPDLGDEAIERAVAELGDVADLLDLGHELLGVDDAADHAAGRALP